MKIRHSVLVLPLLLAGLPLLHCSDDPAPASRLQVGDGGEALADGAAPEPDKPLVPASKVDLLFVVDNSASMGDKQALLATSVSRILRRLVEPSSDHKPVTDLHIGVITSSLGNMAGDVCPEDKPRTNDKAHLRNVLLDGVTVVPGAEAGFLTFGPGGMTDISALETAAKNVILGVGQTGCGIEAQLEAMYRFVAQPDPPTTVTLDQNKKVVFGPVDDVLLAQRRAFFRPDSAVAIVMLTDEDDSMIDPLSVGGKGWGFTSRDYPNSKVSRGTTAQGTTAPRGTSVCDADPASVDCISCAASIDCVSCALCDATPACKAKNDPACSTPGLPGQSGPGIDGFYAPADDDLNIRMQQMKRRYGVDPQYPVERYIKALTNRTVPNRDTEHDANGAYVHASTCTNPLFAASLPASGKEETCKLAQGARSRELVLFQLIGGLPPALAGSSPDWTKILGSNPDKYDQTGIDPHMIQSSTPRQALLSGGDPASPRGQNGTDPVQGREWTSNKKDLMYACTLPLPEERSCVGGSDSCDCADPAVGGSTGAANPPLCKTDGSPVQVRAKAYPTIRELRVAKGLGDRGLVSSICSVDPTSGYGPLLETLATRLSSVLAK